MSLLLQVLFCSDLKKFQSLKETAHLKQPGKDEDGEEEKMPCKKTKVKTECTGTVGNLKTKPACHKEVKISVKKEPVM